MWDLGFVCVVCCRPVSWNPSHLKHLFEYRIKLLSFGHQKQTSWNKWEPFFKAIIQGLMSVVGQLTAYIFLQILVSGHMSGWMKCGIIAVEFAVVFSSSPYFYLTSSPSSSSSLFKIKLNRGQSHGLVSLNQVSFDDPVLHNQFWLWCLLDCWFYVWDMRGELTVIQPSEWVSCVSVGSEKPQPWYILFNFQPSTQTLLCCQDKPYIGNV